MPGRACLLKRATVTPTPTNPVPFAIRGAVGAPGPKLVGCAMAKNTAKLLGLALAGASVYGLWNLGQALLGDEQEAGTRHVLNQV